MTGAADGIGGVQAPVDVLARGVHAAGGNLRYPLMTGEPLAPADGDQGYLGGVTRFATRVAGAWVGNVVTTLGRAGAVVAVAGDITTTLLGIDTLLEALQDLLGLTHGTDGQLRAGNASAIDVLPLSGTVLPSPTSAYGGTFLDTSEEPAVLLRWTGTVWRLAERVETWILPSSTVVAARASSPVAGAGSACTSLGELFWSFPNAGSTSLGDIVKPPRRFSHIKITAYLQTVNTVGTVSMSCAVQGSGASTSGGTYYSAGTSWTPAVANVAEPVVLLPETPIATALLTSTPTDLRGVGIGIGRDVSDAYSGEVRCRGIVVEFS